MNIICAIYTLDARVIQNSSREWEHLHGIHANPNHIGKLHTQRKYQGETWPRKREEEREAIYCLWEIETTKVVLQEKIEGFYNRTMKGGMAAKARWYDNSWSRAGH